MARDHMIVPGTGWQTGKHLVVYTTPGPFYAPSAEGVMTVGAFDDYEDAEAFRDEQNELHAGDDDLPILDQEMPADLKALLRQI